MRAPSTAVPQWMPAEVTARADLRLPHERARVGVERPVDAALLPGADEVLRDAVDLRLEEVRAAAEVVVGPPLQFGEVPDVVRRHRARPLDRAGGQVERDDRLDVVARGAAAVTPLGIA